MGGRKGVKEMRQCIAVVYSVPSTNPSFVSDQILMKDKEIAEMNRHFSDALSIQGGLGSLIPNDSLTPGGGGKGSSLASTFNGVNGGGGGSSSGGGGAGNDSNVAPGFGFGGGSNVTPSTLSLDLPMATDLSSFNGQNRARGKGGEGVGVVGGGTSSGSAGVVTNAVFFINCLPFDN